MYFCTIAILSVPYTEEMVYFTEADVRKLLPMPEAIGLMRVAFEKLDAGTAVNQPRRRLVLPSRSVLHYMAAGDDRYYGAKIYSTNPKHGAHFFFLLFRSSDAQPLAMFEANALGQIRTGAASGLATDLLARPDAKTLAIIGSGFQARTQLEAVRTVRKIESVRVWSPTPEKRDAFAAEFSVEAASSAQEAVRGSAIVVTATNSRDPVLDSAWIESGTHINATGSNQSTRRELPADLIQRADVVAVDSIEQSRMESGDLLMAWGPNEWKDTRLTELTHLVTGKVPGRLAPDAVTIFKSNGLALEDVATAGFVYESALEAGMGRSMAPLYS
jgi:ornithine cyclodeaminase/alanine dehydrogenase-like protein (mu-crystallin family)